MSSLRVILSDARFALRLLYRAPAFDLTLLGVLVSGIGATTAVFSIVQVLVLRPLPYPHPEELTMIWKTYEPVAKEWPASLPDLADFRAENRTFTTIVASGWDAFSLSSDGQPAEYVGGADVSGDFFAMVGVRPQHGRFLNAEDDRTGAARVCVLSADLWRRRFGADPGVVGRVVTFVLIGWLNLRASPGPSAPHGRARSGRRRRARRKRALAASGASGSRSALTAVDSVLPPQARVARARDCTDPLRRSRPFFSPVPLEPRIPRSLHGVLAVVVPGGGP